MSEESDISKFLLKNRKTLLWVFAVSTALWVLLALAAGHAKPYILIRPTLTPTVGVILSPTATRTNTPTPTPDIMSPGTVTPYPTYTPYLTPVPASTPPPMSDEVRIALISAAVALTGSCATSLVSFAGVITSTILTMQKNKRDAELEKARLDLERTKLEKQAKETTQDKGSDKE